MVAWATVLQLLKAMSKKAQAFFEKKKEETKGKMKEEEGSKERDTSKMPEGLRKHFEKKGKK